MPRLIARILVQVLPALVQGQGARQARAGQRNQVGETGQDHARGNAGQERISLSREGGQARTVGAKAGHAGRPQPEPPDYRAPANPIE
jgi:hypothetical protein